MLAANGSCAMKNGVALRLFELGGLLVRFDHVANFIVNANHGVTTFGSCR
jgi:hypothetical protein